MAFVFINRSQQTILIQSNGKSVSLAPQQQIRVDGETGVWQGTLTPAMASSFKERGSVIVDESFVAATQYHITAAAETATVELSVVKLSGMEFYTYVAAASSNAFIVLETAAVADADAVADRVRQTEGYRKSMNRKPRKITPFFLALDTLLFGTPLVFIFFLVGKANFGIVAGILAAIFGYFIAFAVGKIIDALLRDRNGKEDNREEWLQRCLRPETVVAVITDSSRRKNYL